MKDLRMMLDREQTRAIRCRRFARGLARRGYFELALRLLALAVAHDLAVRGLMQATGPSPT